MSEIYSISGQYDLLIKSYLGEDRDIGHFVTEKIQTLPGVRDTFTIITFKAFSSNYPEDRAGPAREPARICLC